MKKLLFAALLLIVVATQVNSQQQSTVPPYLAFDGSILLMREYLRQDQIEPVPSFRWSPNEYFVNVYSPPVLTPPLFYAPFLVDGTVMQRPSYTFPSQVISVGPNNLYLIVIYDFENDLIIEAREWKDSNGNFIAEDNEWFDENGDGIREYGEWTDVNGNGIIDPAEPWVDVIPNNQYDAGEPFTDLDGDGVWDTGELQDLNGNGVFDIGEWHEGADLNWNGFNEQGENNGAVDPNEWIGMNLDRTFTKKLALKIYKKTLFPYYKEIDYQQYIFPTLPAKVAQHPALRNTALPNNNKLVLLLRLEECENCEIVGDVAWFEDEFARIVFNFKGFHKETLHTTLPRCEGCFTAQISHYADLQVYVHEKYDLLYEEFFLHSMEPRGLPDNPDGTTGYYYTPQDEMTRIDDFDRRIRQLVSFDPYYLVVRDNNELTLFETIYGKALIVPHNEKELEHSSHIFVRKFADGTEKDIRIEVVHVYQIETIDCEQVIVARLLVDEDTQMYNSTLTDPDEKLYTVFYFTCSNHLENNVIFPEEFERGLSDFAIIVEKIELESEKVWLKFVREVDSESIPSPAAFPYGSRDYQVVFDELDRTRPLGNCDFYPKDERYVPRFEKILVDISYPARLLLNNVVLRYEDLKGSPTEISSFEEQPWEMAEWNTEVTLLEIKKMAVNPNAADYTGLGYPDYPPAAYVPPLDPAPGLVLTDTNGDLVNDTLLPNFQVSDEDFSGTCAPGDTITFYIEVTNSGGPVLATISDDVPDGMANATVAPPGFVLDTSGDAIFGNAGDTVMWAVILPPGASLFTWQATVLADGSVTFGDTIINSGATVTYSDAGILRTYTAPPVVILVQAAQMIKEAFQELTCINPALTILPGSRLYYRLTVYNTISAASPNPYTAVITQITDDIPALTTNPQDHGSFPALGFGLAITATNITWTHAGFALLPGTFINAGNRNATHSVFVPMGSAGNISNDAELTYGVAFPLPGGTVVVTISNLIQTWIQTVPTLITEPLEPCVRMSIEKEARPTASVGSVISYLITVVNEGQGPYANTYNIVIIDKLPMFASAPFNIASTNPLVTWATYDSNGDGVIDTIVWRLSQMAAGSSFELSFDTTVEQMPYNSYLIKVFTYDLYRQEQDRYLGMGGVSRAGQYTISPEDMTEVIKDAVFTQVMKGAETLENYLMKIFESRFYNKEFYFDFVDFNEKERAGRFRLFTRVTPDIDANIYWGILQEPSMGTGSPQIYSEDTFLAHILLRNDGDGTASKISYEIDAPDFSPVDMTWVYNLEQNLILEIGPGEQAGLLFLMKAPSVTQETTFPVKVKITYSDGVETRTDTKTVYVNVLSQRRANIDLNKTIVEGKSVVQETGKEVADMRVGEERTIVTYIKNVSENEIKQAHYIDQIPQGLEVTEGHPEWMGTLKPGETIKITYKIKVKQIGVYQFRGKVFYKDERNHVYEGVSNITEIRVITDPGPKLRRETDSDIVAKGDRLTVVIRVENDTPNTLENIQVVDLIPEGFQIESLETKGLQQDEGAIRYYIGELEPKKYILLKYVLKAGEKAGKFTYKGVRLAYENGDGLKEEVLTEDQTILIPETETPSLTMLHTLKRQVERDGEYITVILTLPNMGGISARTIKIWASLPEGTTFVEASTNCLQEGGDLTFTIDEVAAGEEVTVKYTFKIPQFNQDRTFPLTFRTLYSDEYDREYSVEGKDEFDVRAQKPNLRVTKVVEKDAVKLNFPVRVAVNIINEGEVAAVTQVADPLPEGMVLLSGTNTWEGRLEPGESAQIIYEMLCTQTGNFQLPTATATYEDRWKISYTSESEPITLNVRGILVGKAVDVTSLKVGEAVVVTITVSNTYDERATNIVIEDQVPDKFTIIEGNTKWTIAVLKPGETTTFTYSLKPEAAGSFNLGAAKATFIDVYNDSHEALSDSVSLSVEEMIPPEEEKPPPTVIPPEEVVGGLTERLIRSFDLTLILIILLLMAITMMLAFLLIERRRTEEEALEAVELLPPPRGEEVWKGMEAGKPPLPPPTERAEAMEEITPLDVLTRRREKIEEKREKIEKVTKILEKEEVRKEPGELEEFEFGEKLVPKKEEREVELEDIFKEELKPEEQKTEPEKQKTEFTDVHDILKMAREEERSRKPKIESEGETTEKIEEMPDIRGLIKGEKKAKEEESEDDDEILNAFNPKDILKGKD